MPPRPARRRWRARRRAGSAPRGPGRARRGRRPARRRASTRTAGPCRRCRARRPRACRGRRRSGRTRSTTARSASTARAPTAAATAARSPPRRPSVRAAQSGARARAYDRRKAMRRQQAAEHQAPADEREGRRRRHQHQHGVERRRTVDQGRRREGPEQHAAPRRAVLAQAAAQPVQRPGRGGSEDEQEDRVALDAAAGLLQPARREGRADRMPGRVHGQPGDPLREVIDEPERVPVDQPEGGLVLRLAPARTGERPPPLVDPVLRGREPGPCHERDPEGGQRGTGGVRRGARRGAGRSPRRLPRRAAATAATGRRPARGARAW